MLKTNKSSSVLGVLSALIFLSFFIFPIKDISAEDATQELAKKYRDTGYELQQKGDLNGALSFYTKAIALEGTTNSVLLNDIGIIYEQLGILHKAEAHYLNAIKNDEHYLPAYSNLAYLYLNQGKSKQAFPYFRKRYELSDLNDPWGQKAKEELLRIRPEFQVWITNFEANQLNQALEQQIQDELTEQVTRSKQYYTRGREFALRKEYEKALVEFNRALSLTPENKKIQNARQEVIRELTSKQIKQRSELAIQKMNAGDSYSAKREIERILTTIPNEPIFNSR